VNQYREQFVTDEFESPAGALEVAVAKILAEVLGIDRVGRKDDFYDFDGTSIQAIRVCARIERELGCQALPRWLFSSSSLADFVKLLQAGEQNSDV
jgi:acyl carrier protein